MNDLKEWLRECWRFDNHVKYQHYFEPWFAALTESQKEYFAQQNATLKTVHLQTG